MARMREKYLAYQRWYTQNCRDEAGRSRERRKDPEYNAQQVERKRLWRLRNRDRHLASSRALDRRKTLQRRISKNLRHRIYKAMLGKTRGVSAVRDLGISIHEFRAFIESQFVGGMSWENYGEWHLDHVRPLALFDLANSDEARAACHYTNLQPLWAHDNQHKYAQAWRVVKGN